MGEIELFIGLVDRGAQAKAFKKLGLGPDDIKHHLSMIDFYRAYVAAYKQIEVVRADPTLTDEEKIKTIEQIKKELEDA